MLVLIPVPRWKLPQYYNIIKKYYAYVLFEYLFRLYFLHLKCKLTKNQVLPDDKNRLGAVVTRTIMTEYQPLA